MTENVVSASSFIGPHTVSRTSCKLYSRPGCCLGITLSVLHNTYVRSFFDFVFPVVLIFGQYLHFFVSHFFLSFFFTSVS